MAGISAILRQLHTLMATQRAEGQTDAHLLEQFLSQHDEGAFAGLLERHGSMVLGVCRRILHDEHAAEDAFQATFLVLVRKAGSIRKRPSIASWLHGVALRLARKAKADATRVNRPDARRSTNADIDVHADASWHEAQSILDDELQRLPEDYRLPLVLCYLEGLTRDEAAAQLGWTSNQLRGFLERGRGRLRSQLLRRGVTLSVAASATLLTDTILASAVPPLLAVTTIHAASRLATGTALTACGVSAPVVALTHGGLKMMASKKLTVILALALLTAVIGTGAGIFGQIPEPTGANEHNDALAPAVAHLELQESNGGPDRLTESLPSGALTRIGSGGWRHGTHIYASALSSDGKRLATASDESVAVRDVASGRVLQKFMFTPGAGFAGPNLVFSPDGKRLGFVRDWSFAHIWDLDTAQEIKRFEGDGRQQFFHGVCRFTPDGKEFVMAVGKQLRYWNLEEGKETRSVAMSNRVLLLSSDAATCACIADDDKTVVLHDAQTGVERARLSVCAQRGRASQEFALSPDGKHAAWVQMDKLEIQICELADSKLTAPFPLPKSAFQYHIDGKDFWEFRLEFSIDGRTLMLGTAGGMVHSWDLAAKKELPALGKHAGTVRGFHPLPDGKSLISTCRDGLIRHWDRGTGRLLFEPESYGGRTNAILSPDGRYVVVGDAQGRLDLWDAASGKRLETLQKRGPAVTQLAISPDGATLAATLYDGILQRDQKADSWVQFWNIPSGQKANSLMTKGEQDLHYVFALQFSPDGRQLCINDARYQGRSWDLGTGKPLWKRYMSFAAFSPDGRSVAAWTNELRFLDAATGEIRKNIVCDPAHPLRMGSYEVFAYSPDGKRMAVTLGNTRFDLERTSIMLLDVETQNLSKPFPAVDIKKARPGVFPQREGYGVHSLAFSPDGKWLLSGGSDRAVRLWDSITSKELMRFDGHTGGVNMVAFSRDGRTAYSSSEDGQVFRWDLRPKRAAVAPPRLDELWTNLGAADAYAATWTLADDRGAPEFLRAKIPPAKPVPIDELAKHIAALDSSRFQDRQAAVKALTAFEDRAAAALQESLRKSPSVEFRRRVEALLAALQGEPDVLALRQLRAVQSLELAGTPGARLVLQGWAGGAVGARLTVDSRAALVRLDHRERSRKGTP